MGIARPVHSVTEYQKLSVFRDLSMDGLVSNLVLGGGVIRLCVVANYIQSRGREGAE